MLEMILTRKQDGTFLAQKCHSFFKAYFMLLCCAQTYSDTYFKVYAYFFKLLSSVVRLALPLLHHTAPQAAMLYELQIRLHSTPQRLIIMIIIPTPLA